MDEMLKTRLGILRDAGEITDEIYSAIREFIEDFEKKYKVNMTEDNASMFITHMAMALARIKKGEAVNPMDEILLEDIKGNDVYDELPEFYEKIESKLNIEIPESEKGFIALHACSLLINEK